MGGGSRRPTSAFFSLEGERVQRYVWATEYCRDLRVIDLGCGYGYGSDYLAKLGGASVIGVDVDSDAIAFAARSYRSPALSFVRADISCLGIASNTFDICVSFEVLEHLPNPGAYLAEARRILTDGGSLLISTPNKLFTEMFYSNGRTTNRFHSKEYYPNEFIDLLTQYFEVRDYLVQFHTLDRLAIEKRAEYYRSLKLPKWIVELVPDWGKNLWLKLNGLAPLRDYRGQWRDFAIKSMTSHVDKTYPVQIAVCRKGAAPG